MYKIKNITKSYQTGEKSIKVLENLCLDIEKGDMVAITGKSGSGKSTLLHLMGLLDNPDTGELEFEDKPISASMKAVESFRNKHIGFVFQFHYLMADFTAVENVALPAAIAGLSWSKAIASAKELLCNMGLSDRLHHYPNQLSGGEQQRVAIARALINKPAIIIADEPTGNLDKACSDEIINILLGLNSSHQQTLILATHDLEIASQMNKHYVLQDKKL